MTLPRFVVDEAIVLKRINYGEADRIVTILTRSYGRLTVLAKGVRKLNSKKSAHLEPFTHIKINVLGGYSLPLITQAQTMNGFAPIRSDFELTKLAFRVLELVERLTTEGDHYPYLFDELCSTLKKIEIGDGESAVEEFLTDFLSSLGYGSIAGLSSSQIEIYLEKILDRKLASSGMF